MKYIVLEMEDGRRLPILFPECLVHAHVAGAIQRAILAMGNSPEQQFHERQCAARLEAAVHGVEGAKPVSAGFASIQDVVVHGKSETLGDLVCNPADRGRMILGDSISHCEDEVVEAMFALWRSQKR